MESAQKNEHLWVNGAAPIDVVDVDALGIGALGARRFPDRPITEYAAQQGISPEIRIFLTLGQELANTRRLLIQLICEGTNHVEQLGDR
jgi:hypothetical protein